MATTPEVLDPSVEARALLSKEQAARYLGVSLNTTKRLIARRELPVVRISPGRVGIRRDELDRFVDARTVPAVDQ